MKGGISVVGIAPEWTAKEVDKSNKLIRAGILESQGETDTAFALYAEVAEMEEQIAAYCSSIGLREKSWINARSAAACWAKAGDLNRALQGYETLLQDTTLPVKMRQRLQAYADQLRAERRQWFAFRQQLHNADTQPAEQEPAQSLVGGGNGV